MCVVGGAGGTVFETTLRGCKNELRKLKADSDGRIILEKANTIKDSLNT